MVGKLNFLFWPQNQLSTPIFIYQPRNYGLELKIQVDYKYFSRKFVLQSHSIIFIYIMGTSMVICTLMISLCLIIQYNEQCYNMVSLEDVVY